MLEKRKRVYKHLGRVGLALGTFVFMTPRALSIDASEAAKQVVASEGGKEVLNAALKIARSKPSISMAASIACLACVPAAGVAYSPAMCIACGILIRETLG